MITHYSKMVDDFFWGGKHSKNVYRAKVGNHLGTFTKAIFESE